MSKSSFDQKKPSKYRDNNTDTVGMVTLGDTVDSMGTFGHIYPEWWLFPRRGSHAILIHIPTA
ncbi:hypothetical protein PG996_005647 [Apiospora saccharicola]|uniref:Uncharacterized protein n=1 Tax=Apiospora saccharicola TaxID=335842 RepID=A0ABR1VM42_9PEZI